jgi:hypothetical protein
MDMGILPEQTYLGQLRFVEVYEATDEPCLFACRNAAGHVFLAVLIDESDEVKDWLYVPLSHDRFARVRSGDIDLYTGFRSAEDGFVHRVSIPIYEGSAIVRTIACDALTNDILPIAGECLSLEVSLVA